jgi:hypothetical protein
LADLQPSERVKSTLHKKIKSKIWNVFVRREKFIRMTLEFLVMVGDGGGGSSMYEKLKYGST